MSRVRLSDLDDHFIGALVWVIRRPRALVLGGIANVLACGALYSVIEGAGPIEGGYWGVVTASSTGYGDFSPEHTLGRLVAVYLIISMIFIWVPAFAAMLIGKVQERTGDDWSHAEQTELLDSVRAIKSDLGLLTGDVAVSIKRDGSAVLRGRVTANDTTITNTEKETT